MSILHCVIHYHFSNPIWGFSCIFLTILFYGVGILAPHPTLLLLLTLRPAWNWQPRPSQSYLKSFARQILCKRSKQMVKTWPHTANQTCDLLQSNSMVVMEFHILWFSYLWLPLRRIVYSWQTICKRWQHEASCHQHFIFDFFHSRILALVPQWENA